MRQLAQAILSILAVIIALATMACCIGSFGSSIENGSVERGDVIDVNTRPHIQSFPDNSTLPSGKAGFDEKRDLHRVWVLDAECD